MKMRQEHKFISGYMAVLALLGTLGYFAGTFTLHQMQARPVVKKTFTTDVAYVPLPDMSMTVASGHGQAGSVQMAISLEVEQKDMARLEDFQPLITERLTNYIQKLDINEISRPDNVPELRRDLLEEVNNASYPVPVLGVVFRQFLVM